MKKNLIIMLLIIILLSITLSTANATDDFSTIADQAKKAYEEGNYGIVIDYLNKMTEIVKSKIGSSNNNELENEQPWKKVISWEGNGLKNTETFKIKSDEWRIKWTNKGDLFQIYVFPKDESAFSFFGLAANTLEPGSDVSYFHEPGEYYLTISAIGSWSVIVEEK